MKPLLLFFFTFICLSPPSVNAFETLKLEDCIREASLNNPDLLSAKLDYEKAIFEYKKSYSNFLPEISLFTTYRRQFNQSPFSNTISSTSSTSNSNNTSTTNSNSGSPYSNQYSIGVNANQNLFAGLRDKNQLKSLDLNVKVSVQTLRDKKLQISYELANAFIETLYSQLLINLLEEIQKRRLLNKKLVQLYYEGGKEHRGNYELSEAGLKLAEYELELAKRNLIINLADLSRVLGKKPGGTFKLQGELIPKSELNIPDYEILASSHPIILSEVYKMRMARLAVDTAESQFYPELNLSLSASQRDTDWFPKKKSMYYSLSFEYPLFRGGKDYYNVRINQTLYRQSIQSYRSKKNQLLFDLEKSYQSFLVLSEKIKVLEKYLEASSLRAKIARVQYSNGLLRFENWDIIESDVIQRQKNLLTGQKEASLAEYIWKKNKGESLIP
ncbi:MAG: TolC family protein [Leptospiraceae bacterium]|nr:TolC family protein [Leptospiraceae bacterium]